MRVGDARIEMLAEAIRIAFPELRVEMHVSGQPGSDVVIALG
ncbi:MAG: hypothetical protein NZ699_04545 [Roseiflexus sp.]|nr:hypothetical protein [Roseiflexus sp.]MCS7288382.1 hypothetical protein [Roseiflexus sp.]MDW8231189.1 hypothetical protein [Roseiflexaceae bacterium]